MKQTERIPAQQLNVHNIFHHDDIDAPEPRDLLVVLDATHVPSGVIVYAVGDPETGDYKALFVAEKTDTVHRYSEHGL